MRVALPRSARRRRLRELGERLSRSTWELADEVVAALADGMDVRDVAEAAGLNRSTILNLARTASAFPPPDRRETLLLSHHQEAVAALPEARQELLDRAVDENWPVARMRREARGPVAAADARLKQRDSDRKERLNRYNARSVLKSEHLNKGPIKEPNNEAETTLLLQAMISSDHPGIDFVIGDYNANLGVDMVIESTDKLMWSTRWTEVVFTLDRLFKWSHPHSGYHVVVCYMLGDVKETQTFPDGSEARLVSKGEGAPGRYRMIVGNDDLDVYVLREILQSTP